MKNAAVTKISKAQRAMLQLILAEGRSVAPGGYRNAGRDASAWYRSAACLERMGLVTATTFHSRTLTLPAPAWVYAEVSNDKA